MLLGTAPQAHAGSNHPAEQLSSASQLAKHGSEPILSSDISLRRTDGEAHFPNHMCLRSTSYVKLFWLPAKSESLLVQF